MWGFPDHANSAIQAKLTELGGRELHGEDDRRVNEIYTISVDGRRFVFCDPAAYNRFDEFVVTELRTLCAQSLGHEPLTQRDAVAASGCLARRSV